MRMTMTMTITILSEEGNSPAGARVLLITDGQDNDPPLTEPYKDIYVANNVVIDAVAFSNTAEENLIDLQEATGGRFYLQTDDPGSTGLHEAFLATMQSGVKEYDRRIELFADSAVYGVSASKRHGVYLDPTVGVKTSFDFSYLVETAFSAIDVIIKSPSGMVFTNDSYEGYGVDLTFKVVSVKFEFAETGFWSYEVFNRHTSEHEVFVSISTYASQVGVDPIIATSELSGSITDFANGQPLIAFSEVRQGLNPVIRANVTATIERPPDANGIPYNSIILQLLDNGAGADVVKDDGIYSRYFTEFTGVGYYGIKININNDDGTAIILNNGDLLSFSRALSYVEPEELLEGNIPKIASFYSIRVSTSLTELRTNYSSATEVNETDILIGDLNTPGNFGDREIFVIQVAVPRNENVVSYVFAMHAVDEEGNSGGMSNVVQATLRKYIPTPPESRNLALYIAIGVLGVIVILMVCLVGESF
ncbi:putative calcium-activated chloride channel regulator 4-like [Apostichopus japonicus]|uniref:Putative calcium-activated chloride channel regulator 4-like n=1 Tax=Stichopus japonicus TaxID=307972 RepID=A0A2G8LP98_STIJA|nr:putative calcium-activated chloride channel regulator 4-like [Apostichopus japonicus]